MLCWSAHNYSNLYSTCVVSVMLVLLSLSLLMMPSMLYSVAVVCVFVVAVVYAVNVDVMNYVVDVVVCCRSVGVVMYDIASHTKTMPTTYVWERGVIHIDVGHVCHASPVVST